MLLSRQVDKIFVGDNTPEGTFSAAEQIVQCMDNVIYCRFECNIGIAAAQNEGIKYFLKKDYDYILFMDQDSLVSENMVVSLCRDMEWLKNHGFHVGGIGPQPINKQNGKRYTEDFNVPTVADGKIIKVNQIISSASLIPVKLIRQVGMMDERLFIDGVDYEWCWRARVMAGVDFFISRTTSMLHQLGEGDKFFLFRKIAITSPFRIYYQYRNYLWLLRRTYVPIRWKLKNGIKYFIKIFYYTLFPSQRKLYARNICKGMKDGFRTPNKARTILKNAKKR